MLIPVDVLLGIVLAPVVRRIYIFFEVKKAHNGDEKQNPDQKYFSLFDCHIIQKNNGNTVAISWLKHGLRLNFQKLKPNRNQPY